MRNTDCKILIDNVDVTKDLSPYLRNVTYEDCLEGETDSLTIELADVESLFIGDWLPKRGSTVSCELIKHWKAEEILPLGTFEVDEISFDFPPSVFKIKANSCPQNSFLRQVDQSKSWENCRLSAIAKDIADAAQVELFYKADDDPLITRAEQGEKSPLNFLNDLCKKYYLALKFADNQIIIFDEKELDTAEPTLTLKRGDPIIKKISIRATLTDIYKSCELNYRHGDKAEKFSAKIDDPTKDSGKILKINRRVENQAEAERVAENELRQKNKKELKLTLTCVGDFRLVAGNVFKLEGFGAFDFNWLIEKARHSIGKGYEVRLDARKCLLAN